MKNTTVDEIKQRLTTALNPSYLEVLDESAGHIDHHAPAGMGHYAVIIATPAFNNLSLAQQHRLIYKAIGSLMDTHIHALRIEIKN